MEGFTLESQISDKADACDATAGITVLPFLQKHFFFPVKDSADNSLKKPGCHIRKLSNGFGKFFPG
jgi:hypothetical protein